jgi:PhzF family phenazine biosynthesis protein
MEHNRTVEVKILNAFVDGDKGGNPAGLVLSAEQYTQAEKQEIASLVGLSETAFVSPSQKADFKLEFFTPSRQIAHCGHATIAAFSYLAQTGTITSATSSKETIDGERAILLEDDLSFMEQVAPKYSTPDAKVADKVLRSLHISQDDLAAGMPVLFVNTGNTFVLIQLEHVDQLKALQPDFDLIGEVSEQHDLIGYYVFVRTEGSRDATARMFAPRYGIPEEGGTGMAAGPLACYLYDVAGLKKTSFLIEQGHFMPEPAPCLLIANLILNENGIERLMVGGKGRLMGVKVLSLPGR